MSSKNWIDRVIPKPANDQGTGKRLWLAELLPAMQKKKG
jgi:hypothetical protein